MYFYFYYFYFIYLFYNYFRAPDTPSGRIMDIVNDMRLEGVRIQNAFKNIGKTNNNILNYFLLINLQKK